MSTLRDYAQLVRLPAIFTVCSNVVAAHLVAAAYWATGASAFESVQLFPLLVTLLASCCFYHGGMVLNDCFDFAIDRQERPSRPLPAGKINIQTAWYFGFGMLLVGALLASTLSLLSFGLAIALSLAILAYNSGSRRGWIAALTMGICRYLNWLLAMSALGLSGQLALLPLPVLLYVTGLTRISQEEVEAKDPSVLVSAATMMVLALITWGGAFIAGWFDSMWALLAVLPAFLWLAREFMRLHQNFRPEAVQRMVGLLIFGLIPLDGLLLASSGQPVMAALLLLLLLPGKWVARYLYVS